jgi:hypothetical protein
VAQPRDDRGRFTAVKESGNGRGDLSRDQLVESLRQHEDSTELLVERIAELELALDDEGWIRLGLEGELDFSLDGIRRIIKLSRLMSIKNPLIKRSVWVQAFYVFGQGMQVRARDARVTSAVDRFLSDPANEKVLTRHSARRDREVDLQVEGNLFLAMFVNSSTGEVKVRFLPVLQIEDIVHNPDDADEPWWYKRVWQERRFNAEKGSYVTKRRVRYYRDWQIPEKPGGRKTIGSDRVADDVWIMHIKVGALPGMKFGVPETYAGMDWARAYKTYLENWASIAKSLARFAWRLRGKTRQLRNAKTKLGTTVGDDEGSAETTPPPGTAGVGLVPENMVLEAIPKTGAQVSANDGLQLRKMVAAGTNTPDPILSNDPQQGSMATARTLDRPTELGMRDRQLMWADIYRDLLGFVVRKQVAAPNGKLKEAVTEDEGEPDLGIEVSFPPLLERDIRDSVRAVVDAYTMGGRPAAGLIPQELTTRMLLVALGAEDIDAVVEEMKKDGDPAITPEERAGLADALREMSQDIRAQLADLQEVGSSGQPVTVDVHVDRAGGDRIVERDGEGNITRIREAREEED